MKKIPTLFLRDPATRFRTLLDEVHPDCQWVIDGEGTATAKLDGTCCMIDDEVLYARREVKRGKPDPAWFLLEDEDPATGKRVGWVPVDLDDPSFRWHREAWEAKLSPREDGTYELVGPKVQGNPHGYPAHQLIRHGAVVLAANPRTKPALIDHLSTTEWEGIVWHHPDGRMAKIKRRDFA